MTTLREAAQQALEALEGGADSWQLVGPAIDALKAALAEPPVDDPHRDHWVAIAEAAQKIAASTECGLAEAKALCTALDRLTEAAQAEPQEPDSPERRCGGPGCDGTCCQTVQEPFGYLWPTGRHPEFRFTQQKRDGVDGMPLYTASPQRKPLSEDEIFKIENDIPDDVIGDRAWTICFARAVERAHGIGGQP